MILAIRTDAPTAELVLVDEQGKIVAREEWLAERRLASELLSKLEALLQCNGSSWELLSGLIVFKGPGSFTGLRIGITVMNTIAYAEHVPIVGEAGEEWLTEGGIRLRKAENDQIVLPEYGAPARITQPRK